MKNRIKPILIVFLMGVFVALAIMPSNLSGVNSLIKGQKDVFNGIDTCVCPVGESNCQCLLLKLEPVGF